MMDWYLEAYGDPLCKHVPPWFRALVWSEVFLQLPFFCYGAWAFAVGDSRVRKPVRRNALAARWICTVRASAQGQLAALPAAWRLCVPARLL